MTTIREKIMGLDPHEPTFYYCGYSDGLKKAADIAEAEVARLEARVRELEEVLRDVHMISPGQPGHGDLSRTQRTISDIKRVIGGE